MIETLTVPAHLDSLKPIAEYVMKVAKMAGLDKKSMYKLRLAVDELATNMLIMLMPMIMTTKKIYH